MQTTTQKVATLALQLATAYLNAGDAGAAADELATYLATRAQLATEPYTGADADAAELATELSA